MFGLGKFGKEVGNGKTKMDERSLMPSHIPSCSALRRPVIRFVLPQRRKSASFNWPINACLHASALGDSCSLSFGGVARWRVRRKGTAWARAEPEAPEREAVR